jgi:hypothetical protein
MGFTPVACDKDGIDTSPPTDSGDLGEPEYGAPVTDPIGDDDPVDSGQDGVDSGDEPEPIAEPEYGVPVSDDINEPEYGVPDSGSF